MLGSVHRSFTARHRRRAAFFAAVLALGASIPACKPQARTVGKTPPTATVDDDLASELATARIDGAKMKLEQKRPAEALALMVSALKANPGSQEARSMVETTFTETVWNLPQLSADHQLPIEQISVDGTDSLWVSLGGEASTTVRWHLETLQIESVLFPADESKTRSLIFDARHQWAVIERGPVTLLCNAQTLKPICDLGTLPPTLTPSSVVVFSSDGLLMAHPGYVSEQDRSVIWRLRDSATGQIIRASDPIAADASQPLAATLDRNRLRVLHTDGSSLEIPISPVEEIRKVPAPQPVKLLQAQFSIDGNSVLTLQEERPHEPLVQSVISYQSAEDGSLEGPALAQRFPWSRQPNIWAGLMNDPQRAPFWVEGNLVKILTDSHAPIETTSPITAVAFSHGKVITGEESGRLTIHQLMPLPNRIQEERQPRSLDKAELTSLEYLSEALSGTRYHEKERTFSRLTTEDRTTAFRACNFDKIRATLPKLDFAPVIRSFEASTQRIAMPAAFLPLWERLAQADITGKSSPKLLKLSGDLAGEPSPAPAKMEEIFRAGDSSAILAAIQSAGGKGPAAAVALALALKSDHHEWITAILTQAEDLPPLLRQISLSRIAWLQGRKAQALSVWPEVIPELAAVRLREDWQGWELADFQPALDDIRRCVSGELAAIEVPESATPEQRKAVAERLNDPATVEIVGERRFAEACLKAALAFSTHKEETEMTFQLANLARKMGAPPEPCLRAEALALTALGDYQKAHPRWIELITEHPIETTLPSDYAEAAYTAFENADPQQAMEILTTGMHRFPQDGNFALRAGWVALLTNNPERAYQFLQNGKRIGFPTEKLENATALLTIAAAQSGAQDDATVYFQELLKIDPAWADAATLDTLDWPEELKATLAQFSH